MSKEHYYEDFKVGQQFKSTRSHVMEKSDAIAFASEYDPQEQHIDEKGAENGLHGRLIVSGWHTAVVSMRLKTETELFQVPGNVIGMGLENVRWPKPVFPGDSIRVVVTVLEMRESKSRPERGIIKYKTETFNQNGELVMEMVTAIMMPRRNPA